jgi:hypothetical protein
MTPKPNFPSRAHANAQARLHRTNARAHAVSHVSTLLSAGAFRDKTLAEELAPVLAYLTKKNASRERAVRAAHHEEVLHDAAVQATEGPPSSELSEAKERVTAARNEVARYKKVVADAKERAKQAGNRMVAVCHAEALLKMAGGEAAEALLSSAVGDRAAAMRLDATEQRVLRAAETQLFEAEGRLATAKRAKKMTKWADAAEARQTVQ